MKKANTPIWILGPCAIESPELYMETGKFLSNIMKGKNWYYKSSFDKANRSSIHGKRGLGLKDSLALFKKIKKAIPGIKLTTDFHTPDQARKLAGYVDVIQIPAFLCRQTDMLAEAGSYFEIVNIKKGQWVSPENIIHSAAKVRSKNPKAKVWLTERGTFFGYEHLTVDFGSVDLYKKYFDVVVLDTTHSTQFVKDGFTLGNRDLAERFLLASSIFGYTGIFAETHPKPPEAITDGMCQIYLNRMENLIKNYDKVMQSLT